MNKIKIRVIDQAGNDTHSGIDYMVQGEVTTKETLAARDHMLDRLKWLGIRVTEVICHRDEIKIWRAA